MNDKIDSPANMQANESPEGGREVVAIDNGLQRGRPFQAGVSGNPKGRPRGSRNRATLAQEMLDEHAEAIWAGIIEGALKRDALCLRICAERMLPALREPVFSFELPDIHKIEDVAKASEALIHAFHTGQVPASAVEKFMALIAFHKSNLVAALEQASAQTGGENAKVIDVPAFDPFKDAATDFEAETRIKIESPQAKSVH
jgi:Family of unknown function (DUF5681)